MQVVPISLPTATKSNSTLAPSIPTWVGQAILGGNHVRPPHPHLSALEVHATEETIMEYTLLKFAEEFRLLLLKTHKAGFDVDDIGAIADAVLEASWDEPVTKGTFVLTVE